MEKRTEVPVNQVAEALFIVNRHAKTALDPRLLYDMKKKTISKLLRENKAKKIGLHFSNQPKLSHQHSTLLVKVSNYYFHIPPAKEDFQKLSHLGKLDADYRNPKTKMPLSKAKQTLGDYIGIQIQDQKSKDPSHLNSSYYTPSSLGQLDWSPKRRRGN